MSNAIVADATEQFRRKLSDLVREMPPETWDASSLDGFVSRLKVVANDAAGTALRLAVEEAETREDEIEHEGRLFRFKEVSKKEWLTAFGKMIVQRRYFRPVDRLGGGFCPLDVRCSMQGRFMMPDVEELAAYACGHMVPAEVQRFLCRVIPDAPSTTAIPITRAGCFAHARRKVAEAWDTGAKDAARLLLLIRRVFHIESVLKKRASATGMDEADFHALRLKVRQRRSIVALRQIEAELDRLWVQRSVTPKSLLGKSLRYLERQWTRLTQFTTNGALEIHNNDAERALRQVAVGRKNWMVFGSPKGGWAASQLYALVLSCKAKDIDPDAYLRDVLARISTTPASDVATLTPWAWADAQAATSRLRTDRSSRYLASAHRATM